MLDSIVGRECLLNNSGPFTVSFKPKIVDYLAETEGQFAGRIEVSRAIEIRRTRYVWCNARLTSAVANKLWAELKESTITWKGVAIRIADAEQI
jgi:hypothetical protein